MSQAPAEKVWTRLRADKVTLGCLLALLVLLSLSALAPLLPLAEPDRTDLASRLLTPLVSGHWLGTDQLGRDVLSRVLFGSRLSLAVAFAGVMFAVLAGSALGMLAGYYGGFIDGALMRATDVVMAFPYLLLALVIVAVLGPGLQNATLAIALVNVPFFARTVRGQVLGMKHYAFVDAARGSGFGDVRILVSEMLPSIVPTILVAASTSSGWMILETAGLSFLGLGAQPPTADLGGMLGQGRYLLGTAPHVALVPGGVIFVIVALLNLVGDGLRDALDPKHGPSRGASRRGRGGEGSSRGDEPSDPAPLLEVRELSVAFSGFEAVRGVSFSVHEGESVALVGESGSGKSVTALAVLDLLDARARVKSRVLAFAGESLATLDARQLSRLRGGRIAWIPQDPMTSLHPLLRVERQLVEVLQRHQGLAADAAHKRARDLLSDVGIADPEARLSSYPHELSGGMRQRVVIAMALAGNPQLLILDEPTTALDTTTQAAVIELLRSLCTERNAALLFISHDLAVVSQLCQRALVMHEGRVVEDGSVQDITERPAHDYTRRLVAAVPQLGRPEKILDAPDGGAGERR